MKRRTLAVMSDLHVGSTVGLCPPGDIPQDDGGAYRRSNAQDYLWEIYKDFWGQFPSPNRRKGWFGVLLNGDLVDGDHHGTYQIISRDLAVQSHALMECLTLVTKLKPDAIFVIRGTESHVGSAGAAENTCARRLRDMGQNVIPDQDTGQLSCWHFRGSLDGFRIDAAHHGKGVGRLPWTDKAGIVRAAAEIYFEHLDDGEPYPHLAIRSHFHRHFDSENAYKTRLIQTPALQLATSYVHKKFAGKPAHLGGIVVHLADGRLERVDNHIVKPARSSVWIAP